MVSFIARTREEDPEYGYDRSPPTSLSEKIKRQLSALGFLQ